MAWANRNGFFYLLDRNTGEFLLAKSFYQFFCADVVFDSAFRKSLAIWLQAPPFIAVRNKFVKKHRK